MPQYRVTDPQSGRTVTLRGDSPPTEQELEAVFAELSSSPSVMDRAVEALPSIGGAAGFLVRRNPLGMALSGLGGAAGKAIELEARGLRGDKTVPQTVFGQFKEIAGEGVKQAGLEVVGRGIAGVATRGAKRLYQAALKPSVALRREFPDVAMTGIRERIPVTPRGTRTSERRVREGGESIRSELERASAAGSPAGAGLLHVPARVSGKPAIRVLREPLADARRQIRIGEPDRTGAVVDRAQRIRQKFRGGVPILEAQRLKQTAQGVADRAFRQQEAGAVLGIEPQVQRAVARGLRQSIEEVAPSVAALNQRERGLIGLREGLEAAEGRIQNNLPAAFGMRALIGSGVGTGAGLASGDPMTGIATGLAVAGLSSPGSLSRGAIALDQTGRMSPQLLRLLEQLYQQQQLTGGQ